jgi:diaminohydroxyphosphoribosylaminopyrimidine deaminase / 5-amino-6-(5-phosphoribosylamino)uracil reductase
MSIMTSLDTHWMQIALHLSNRAIGRTAENPAVGCVLVRDGQCVGQGWTADGGRPHAETQAIASAGVKAQGATAYVTLEPCAHTGKTPPCASALIQAGITKVVIACEDADVRVAGRGIAMLRDAGCIVEVGICAKEAHAIHAGFFRSIREGFPQISIKIATSMDEKIALKTLTSPLSITGEHARNYGHLLRSKHQAIVTGIGTVLADDPLLNCRLSGLTHTSPVRVILDRSLKIPLTAALVTTASAFPTLVLTEYSCCESEKAHKLKAHGVECMFLREAFTFGEAMQALAARGYHRVLIEGGQQLTSAALNADIANRLYWFAAPHKIGEEGMLALKDGQSLNNHMHSSALVRKTILGVDTLYEVML